MVTLDVAICFSFERKSLSHTKSSSPDSTRESREEEAFSAAEAALQLVTSGAVYFQLLV